MSLSLITRSSSSTKWVRIKSHSDYLPILQSVRQSFSIMGHSYLCQEQNLLIVPRISYIIKLNDSCLFVCLCGVD